jgi:EAL domain-containing protein (putative c-di-GMP-specific phosphodiesterase class I)
MGEQAERNESSILVIHDDEVDGARLRHLLGQAGYSRVALLPDPDRATEGLASFQPDLILVNVQAIEAAEAAVHALHDAMAKRGDRAPVVAFSGGSAENAVRRLLRAGAVDVVVMPVDPKEVLLRIANHLDARLTQSRLIRENGRLHAQLAELRNEDTVDWDERKLVTDRVNSVLNGEILTMAFQPIFDLQTGRTVGAESLARFACTPQRSPAEWFAAAAEHGMALQLELAAIAAALAALDDLPPDVYLSFNVSPEVALSPAFASTLRDAPMHRLVIELTEADPVDDYRPLLEALRPMRKLGARLAIDDTGSGFAGLERIVRLEPDIVKLDRSLIDGIDDDPARRALVAALVMFASEIGAELVAAGIETDAEFDLLRELRVAHGQGYFLARPAPLPLARATGAENEPIRLDEEPAVPAPVAPLAPVAAVASTPAEPRSPFGRPQTSRLAGALRPVEPEPVGAVAAAAGHRRTAGSPSLELARARANARVASR